MRIRGWVKTTNARFQNRDEKNEGLVDRVLDPLLSSVSYLECCTRYSSTVQTSE